MMPAGPAGSEPDCVPPAEVLAGVGSLVSHWDSAVPSCLWGCGDEILMGWWLLWSSRRIRRYWEFPQLQCSSELPWQWGGWGGRQVLSHKLTKSSGTLIKINIKQKCFSDWTIKYSRSFSEVSYPVSKIFFTEFCMLQGKTPQIFMNQLLCWRKPLYKKIFNQLLLHYSSPAPPSCCNQKLMVTLLLHRWEESMCGYWF